MNRYMTHTCGELRSEHEGQSVSLSGWIHSMRDHGGVLFIDLRDPFPVGDDGDQRYEVGITQVVVRPSAEFFDDVKKLKNESVITVEGKVHLRDPELVNPKLHTGEIEVVATAFNLESRVEFEENRGLPVPVADETDVPENIRLRHRFLDLRRARMRRNILLRADIISSIRRRMTEMGFVEFQTPILTKSSPEGARDYLVPSRIHPGKFYALPQAPQQFKQLLMVSGFHKYFQIAPCFRDEDARADRSPGEFYQLDMEMTFVEQWQVFEVIEHLMYGLFQEFSDWKVNETPFPRIPYREALAKYGTDKPDLRNPLELKDVSEVFRSSEFRVFRSAVESGGVVRALPVPNSAGQPRSFVDGLEKYMKELGSKGLAYVIFPSQEEQKLKGPVAKYLSESELDALRQLSFAPKDEDAEPIQDATCFLLAGPEKQVNMLAGRLRQRVAELLELGNTNEFQFCWIVDYPMYEENEETHQPEFSHNPFSMPQGGMEALTEKDPLDILAYQYDIVCNGVELSSGAIRNHDPDIMYKAFSIAGYGPEVVDSQFGGMIRAFKYGAPPHGGIAPGIDRIVMLIAGEQNIREVIAFPMNQNAEDLLMAAPSEVTEQQLQDLHIRIELPPEEEQ